jgi:hypothetical protein
MNKTSAAGEEDDGSMTQAHMEGFKSALRRSLEQHAQQGHHSQTISSTSFATPKKATIKSRYQGSGGLASKINYDMDMDLQEDL